MSQPQGSDPAHLAVEAVAPTGADSPPADGFPAQEPRALVDAAVTTIAQTAPAGWQSVHGVFSMAGGHEIAQAVAAMPEGRVAFPVMAAALDPIRRHREATVGDRGPWLRLLFDLDRSGQLKVGFDFGETEIPADQLLPPEAYLRDFHTHPRQDAPVWLLAHMGNDGRQTRSPALARKQATRPAYPRPSPDEIPRLPELWARMAALAAVCQGAGAPIGPRFDPTFALHRGERGGCTLAKLPDGRAVLSGSRDESPLLRAAYQGEIDWPDLYRGAPQWMHDLYLDPRAARGTLTFCYWWDGTTWLRSDLPETEPLGDRWRPIDEITDGMPGVWTTETTAEVIAAVLRSVGVGVEPTVHTGYLVRAAEARIASERHVAQLFGGSAPTTFDMAEAVAQLDAAGVLLPSWPSISETNARALVTQHCTARHIDPAWHSPDRLAATRLDAGWRFSVAGDAAVPVVFLVADDGMVDEAPPSMQPDDMQQTFSERFAARIRGIR